LRSRFRPSTATTPVTLSVIVAPTPAVPLAYVLAGKAAVVATSAVGLVVNPWIPAST
jgi:hypothetical protein